MKVLRRFVLAAVAMLLCWNGSQSSAADARRKNQRANREFSLSPKASNSYTML